MESAVKSGKLHIGGMSCVNCQNKIQKKLLKTAGIKKAEVSYNEGTADIIYDADIISLGDIITIINKMDYEIITDNHPPDTEKHVIGILIIIAALYVIMEQYGVLNLLAPGQLAETNMGYGMLFVIGLVTSVHCIAMCGGINLSQCIPQDEKELQGKSRICAMGPSFLYNLGRVVSYTCVGFIVGGLGSAITFSNTAQGVLKLAAGLFMVIMGINMLGIFPWLRKLNPRLPQILAGKINKEKANRKSPLAVGLLNGLMPCGPLQAMQIYALSTGNPFSGALSMFLFSLGTVPLMFGLGALSSILSQRFSKRVMTAGAVLVVVLGLSMFSQGISLVPSQNVSKNANAGSATISEDGVQIIYSTLSARRYPAITVQAGTPVKWIIDAPQGSINGCNNRLFINEYGIEYTFKTGENIIEFMPENTGTFRYSCWMGMIRSTITVVEEGEAVEAARPEADFDMLTSLLPEPVPANYVIPADEIAVAEQLTEEDGYEYQAVKITLSDDGYAPAVMIVQSGVDTLWEVENISSLASNSELQIPAFFTELVLDTGENPLYFYPSESFDFSNGNNTFYGYVKVVDDINAVDYEAVRDEIRNYETQIYPSDAALAGGGGSCCD